MARGRKGAKSDHQVRQIGGLRGLVFASGELPGCNGSIQKPGPEQADLAARVANTKRNGFVCPGPRQVAIKARPIVTVFSKQRLPATVSFQAAEPEAGRSPDR
jgi:hypothetical protein